MSAKTKIILDVDTGTDDAVAIMMAYLDSQIELLAVCTVAGNVGLEYTTENTLRVKDMLKGDFPVYRGCKTPLVSTLLPGRRSIIGAQREKRMHPDYLDLPKSVTKVEDKHAVLFYIEALMKSNGDITIVPVGPLTNLAMAMRIEPAICTKIRQIVLMGGGDRYANITPAAEFNIWYDPEAAQIVLESGVPITIVPLDATMKAQVSSAETAVMRSMHNAVGDAVADCIDHRIAAYRQNMAAEETVSAPVHDALAVCAVVNPAVLRDVRLCRVDVDFSGGLADGHMIVDPRTSADKPCNADFAYGSDCDMFCRWMLDNIKAFR